MLKRFTILLFILAASSQLFSAEIKKEYDSSSRLYKINHFNENQLIEAEEYAYADESDKPAKILFKKRQGNSLIPYKELKYSYESSNVSSIEFYSIEEGERIDQGKITFTYEEGKLTFIKYFIRLKPSDKLFMFALQQHLYMETNLITRRFVQYEINPESLKPMQSSQHVFFYKDNTPESMKAWILEEDTQKIIENCEKDLTIIEKIIEDIEKKCIYRSSGNTFTRI